MKRALIISLVALTVTLALLVAGWTWDEDSSRAACGSLIIACGG